MNPWLRTLVLSAISSASACGPALWYGQPLETRHPRGVVYVGYEYPVGRPWQPVHVATGPWQSDPRARDPNVPAQATPVTPQPPRPAVVALAPSVEMHRCPGGVQPGTVPCEGEPVGAPIVGPTVPCDGRPHPHSDASGPSLRAQLSPPSVRSVSIAGSATPIDPMQIALAGTDLPDGAQIVDGELEPTVSRTHASGADREIDLAGGHVVLARADGTHIDADVLGGRVQLHRTGRGTHARTRASGTIRVRVRRPPTEFVRPTLPIRHRRAATTRERAALAGLLAAHPLGSPERARLASAVEHVNDQLEDGPVMFYNIPIVGHSLVLVVDVSYSMRDPDPQAIGGGETPSKLDMLRAQLVRLLASLPPDVEINIVAFSSSPLAMWDRPRALDPDSLRAAIAWIGSLHPIDETHPLDAVREAQQSHPDQMILLTDGRPTFASEEEPSLLELAAQMPTHGARLDCVGIGPDQDRTFLDTLAQRAHGIAFHE